MVCSHQKSDDREVLIFTVRDTRAARGFNTPGETTSSHGMLTTQCVRDSVT